VRVPSLIASLFIVCVYLFAALPLITGVVYLLTMMGASAGSIRSNLSEVTVTVQMAVGSTVAIVLLKKYHSYLLSDEWEKNILSFLKVGAKWSIPILLVHFAVFIVPFFRERLLENHIIIKEFWFHNTPVLKTIIFSFLLVIGAISEELIFRGIILQKLNLFFKERSCVFISAGLFAFSHFVFSQIKIGYLISSFAIGLLCGFAFFSTRSCISALIPHLLNNIIFVGYLWMGHCFSLTP
jgi:membrane protease YdiL (CAAX protease family)